MAAGITVTLPSVSAPGSHKHVFIVFYIVYLVLSYYLLYSSSGLFTDVFHIKTNIHTQSLILLTGGWSGKPSSLVLRQVALWLLESQVPGDSATGVRVWYITSNLMTCSLSQSFHLPTECKKQHLTKTDPFILLTCRTRKSKDTVLIIVVIVAIFRVFFVLEGDFLQSSISVSWPWTDFDPMFL